MKSIRTDAGDLPYNIGADIRDWIESSALTYIPRLEVRVKMKNDWDIPACFY
jgi:hypothetical protein